MSTSHRGAAIADRVFLKWFERVAQVAVFAMMLLILADVVLRYALGAQVGGGIEIVSLLLLPTVIFWGLGSTAKAGGHIRVDIFYQWFPVAVQSFIRRGSHLIAAALWGCIGYMLASRSLLSLERGEALFVGFSFPVWSTYAASAIGAVAMAAASLSFAIWDTSAGREAEQTEEGSL